MRALIVEDDPGIRSFVLQALRGAGLAADAAADAASALEIAVEQIHDVLIVDLGLPDMDGLRLIDELRGRGVAAPVLILSARRSVEDRVRGLERGGDDYLPKPFAIAELVARLQALVRRSTQTTAQMAPEICIADLTLDPLRHEAQRAGRPLWLSPREFRLLQYLAENRGRVLSRTMILDHVWQMRFDPGTNVVDVHVHRLRRKIDHGFTPRLIHTVRGVGYVLRADG